MNGCPRPLRLLPKSKVSGPSTSTVAGGSGKLLLPGEDNFIGFVGRKERRRHRRDGGHYVNATAKKTQRIIGVNDSGWVARRSIDRYRASPSNEAESVG